MSLGPLYVFLGEVSVQVLCPFFNWVVCLPGVELCEFLRYFEDQGLVWGIIAKYVFPFSWFFFYFNTVFFSHSEAFCFDEVPFVYSFLYVPSFRGHVCEDVAAWNVWDFPANVFLQDFYGVTTYILVFYLPWIYVCVWGKLVIEFHFSAHCCPDLPTPFTEETIFAPFYAPASFVKY